MAVQLRPRVQEISAMATLVLPELQTVPNPDLLAAGSSIRLWLKDDWAILFSHPNDFVSCDLELDRWLVILRRTFVDHGVRPIALAKSARQLDCGWVTQVSGDPSTVLLSDPVELVDLHARRLREAIGSMEQRFVMIIDAMLCRRETHSYSDLAHLPSPLDFVGRVKALRETPATDRRAIDSRAATTWSARPRKHRGVESHSHSAA
jgi:hypothetical protein